MLHNFVCVDSLYVCVCVCVLMSKLVTNFNGGFKHNPMHRKTTDLSHPKNEGSVEESMDMRGMGGGRGGEGRGGEGRGGEGRGGEREGREGEGKGRGRGGGGGGRGGGKGER